MKPFPYTEVNAIEKEMTIMRDEVSRLRVQLENTQRCLNSLQRKRQNLIDDASAPEGNLFEQMFGEKVSVPSIYTDTPMAEEIYGG
tara:strand:- start:436 stop:693 length:258 start_codon:yes stop_codon:yes gene_type:complete